MVVARGLRIGRHCFGTVWDAMGAICSALQGASGSSQGVPADAGVVASYGEMEERLAVRVAGGGGVREEEETWRENAFYAHNYVLRCVVEQHVEARMALEESAGKTLVYCAAHDVVWGIGRSILDPARFLPSRWGGRNELGKSLMAVRAEISGGSPSVPPKKLQLFTQLLE